MVIYILGMRIVLPMDIWPPIFARIQPYYYEWVKEQVRKERRVSWVVFSCGLFAAAVAWISHRYLYEIGGYAPGFSTLTGQHNTDSGFIAVYAVLLIGLAVYAWAMTHAIFGRPLYRWNKAHFFGSVPVMGWSRFLDHTYVPRYVLVLLATALLSFGLWHVASDQSIFASELCSFAILLATATGGAFLFRWTPVNSLGANI